MTGAEWLALGVLGGVLGLDTVSFPQAMFSRPIVACTVAAAFAGQPMAGLLLGALVESFALETLPVGASRYPEWGAASVIGGTLVARSPAWHEGTVMLALLATLATGWLGGWSMVQLRKANASWAHARQEALRAGERRAVTGLQVHGLVADLLRGAAVTLAAGVVLFPVVGWLDTRWHLDPLLTRAVLVSMAGIMAAGAVHKVFHGVTHTRWYFLVGAMLGLAAVWPR
jgi:PTS system mannose-specific IIC component